MGEEKPLYRMTIHRLIITAQEQKVMEGDPVQVMMETSTRTAVDEAIHHILERNSHRASSGHTMSAEDLRRWFVVCMTAVFGLLATVMLAAVFLVPSAHDLSALRLEKADLEARVAELKSQGGRIQLTTCGDKKRLCALVDDEQSKNNSPTHKPSSAGEHWMILKGY